jgi:hypothetical protein
MRGDTQRSSLVTPGWFLVGVALGLLGYLALLVVLGVIRWT